MIKLPQVVGLYPCERIDLNMQTGQVSFIGVFHSLHFRTFPSPGTKFTVYAALYDGVGEGRMDLLITRLETERDIYHKRRWYAFPGRGVLTHVDFLVPNLAFSAPGRYRFRLSFEQRELSQRLVNIYRG